MNQYIIYIMEDHTPHLAIFFKGAEHDHDLALELPDHAPEVVHGGLQGGLSSNVCIPMLVALQGVWQET